MSTQIDQSQIGISPSPTGTTLLFTKNAKYNKVDYLTSGDITLDLTNAIEDVTVLCYFNGYIPNITGADWVISAGSFDANVLNLVSFFYDGNRIFANIGNIPTLLAPSLTLVEGNGSIQADWTASSGANNYILEIDTNSDFSTSTEIYTGPLLTFNITGLTNDTIYYVRIKAEGNNIISSGFTSDNSTPILGNILLNEPFDGTSLNSSLWTFNNGSGGLSINNEVRLLDKASSSAFFDSNGKFEFDTTGETTVIRIDINHHGLPNCNFIYFRTLIKPGFSEDVRFRINTNSFLDYFITGTGYVSTGVSANGSYKIVMNGSGTVTYYKWDGIDAWDSLGSGGYVDGNHYLQVRIQAGLTDNVDSQTELDNLYVTDYDYTTLTP